MEASRSDSVRGGGRETGGREFETILLERKGRVGLITLNRPKALNALNAQVLDDVIAALDELENDNEIGAVVITGSEKAFAAGADIKEMQPQSYMDMFMNDFFARWDRLAAFRKPTIAAVAGYALGGGCELAMICDILIAADTAKFGQPEIKLGVIPGIGGSQRLTRAIGKAKAMDLVLTGRTMDVEEAERAGLVSRIVPAAELLDTALEVADTIASMSLPVAMIAKESVNRSFETTLAEGLRFERRVFHSLFAIEDQKEGMSAFVEKRQAKFTNR
ncbi:enoyl-CoA hydratase [Nocardia cyriacigeorgica]|uniref:Probable enoyl-CoA hydratase echA8 n=1 Tax=Nocardia cyriacigeorgica TaxID=135487 RepID=A0A6P1DDG9_9NOCA|nr:enoyl-CoA hydratase [Nocardia cyriacigeorgica]NEW41785.1 enoyl-CoA hydratase [Nocardia cyriacigeorgica]NEW47589.1 enoyl-CoA hydratase [Nocardia cyriacigeorgica]NEW56797.1 enoyl-CoA hydratase [Nocardia cyriacigeorgica]